MKKKSCSVLFDWSCDLLLSHKLIAGDTSGQGEELRLTESSPCPLTVSSAKPMQMSSASLSREENKQYNTVLVAQKDFRNFQLILESILNSA